MRTKKNARAYVRARAYVKGIVADVNTALGMKDLALAQKTFKDSNQTMALVETAKAQGLATDDMLKEYHRLVGHRDRLVAAALDVIVAVRRR